MATATPIYTDYQYLIAYATLIILFLLAIKSRFGYVTIYYALLLFSFSLVLINGKFLVNLLSPLQTSQ